MSITIIIIIFTCAISFYAWNNNELYQKLIFNPYSVFHRKEYFRMFSSALLHADIPHLAINMFVLYSFSQLVEPYYRSYMPMGLTTYLALYILSVAAANMKTLYDNKNNVWYNAVGASGAVSAIVYAFVLIAPTDNLYFFGLLPIPAFIFGFLYLAYSQYMAKRAKDNIGHDAHFYGAVFGFVFTGLLKPDLFPQFIHQIINW